MDFGQPSEAVYHNFLRYHPTIARSLWRNTPTINRITNLIITYYI